MHTPRATTARQATFAWHLCTGTGTIAGAREAFRGWLHASPATDDDVADLAVVLSELASNAVTGAGEDDAHIRASIDDDVLLLEVSNPISDDAAEIVRWDLDDPLRGGGRGLMIVRAYTDSLEIGTDQGTVTVRCTRQLDAR